MTTGITDEGVVWYECDVPECDYVCESFTYDHKPSPTFKSHVREHNLTHVAFVEGHFVSGVPA